MLEDKTELPVPKVLETGLRSGLMPGEFVTKEYINGQNLGDAGESLSRQEAVAVYSQIGTMLSSFHQISAFSHFGGGLAYKDGEVRAKSREGIDTSHTAREYELQRGLKIVKASFQTPFAKWGSRLEGWVRKGIEVFSEDVQPCLTHGDFSATNIMVSGDTVTGLLDFEGVGPGYGIQDISRLYNHFSHEVYDLGFDREDLMASCLEAFWKAYDAPLHKDYELHLEYYRLRYPLGYLTCWGFIEDAYEKQELKEITEYMNNRIAVILG